MIAIDDGPTRDQIWPYRVALLANRCQGTHGLTILEFSKNLQMCEVHDSMRRHGKEYWIYRFANRNDAEKFRERFNGELVT